MPSVRITSVMPSATMVSTAACSPTLGDWLRGEEVRTGDTEQHAHRHQQPGGPGRARDRVDDRAAARDRLVRQLQAAHANDSG